MRGDTIQGRSMSEQPRHRLLVSRRGVAAGSTTMSTHPQDLEVFVSSRASTCDECGQLLCRSAWICLFGERGALCLSCADLDQLVFLPAGTSH